MTTTKVIKSVNELYPLIGDGLYQVISILIICCAMVPIAMQQYIMIFIALPPPWKLVNSTKVYHSREVGYTEKCSLEKSKWMWAESKEYSIVNEFDLHCDRESLVHTTIMLQFVLSMCGSFFWGYISDRFGRQKALLYGSFCNICCALLNAYSINLAMFMILKAMNGFFSGALMIVMVIYGAEIVSEKKRTISGMFVWTFYAIGGYLMVLISYSTKNWRSLLIYCSAPFLIIVVLLRFLPESIAWEFNKGREKYVQKKLKIIKIVNHHRKTSYEETTFHIQTNNQSKKKTLSNFYLLWSPWKMALQTICLALSWISLSISYIGMSYAAQNITGSTHRDFALLNSSEIISCFLAIVGSSRFGRKKTIISAMVMGGICIIIVASIPETNKNSNFYWIRLAFGVLGKLFAAIVIDVIYTWTAETYPTFLRSMASGFYQALSFVGMTIAPWIALWLDRYHPSLPYFTMGGLLLLSSIPLFRIRETGGEALSEQIEIANDKCEKDINENKQFLLENMPLAKDT